MAHAVRYEVKSDTFERPRIGGEGVSIELAMTDGTHAPGVTQAVNLCDKDFVELAKTKDAINDSLITIPDNTRLYIASFAGKVRILQAFICGDTP